MLSLVLQHLPVELVCQQVDRGVQVRMLAGAMDLLAGTCSVTSAFWPSLEGKGHVRVEHVVEDGA